MLVILKMSEFFSFWKSLHLSLKPSDFTLPCIPKPGVPALWHSILLLLVVQTCGLGCPKMNEHILGKDIKWLSPGFIVIIRGYQNRKLSLLICHSFPLMKPNRISESKDSYFLCESKTRGLRHVRNMSSDLLSLYDPKHAICSLQVRYVKMHNDADQNQNSVLTVK